MVSLDSPGGRAVGAGTAEDIATIRIFHDGRSCSIAASQYSAVNAKLLTDEIVRTALDAVSANTSSTRTNPSTQYVIRRDV